MPLSCLKKLFKRRIFSTSKTTFSCNAEIQEGLYRWCNHARVVEPVRSTQDEVKKAILGENEVKKGNTTLNGWLLTKKKKV